MGLTKHGFEEAKAYFGPDVKLCPPWLFEGLNAYSDGVAGCFHRWLEVPVPYANYDGSEVKFRIEKMHICRYCFVRRCERLLGVNNSRCEMAVHHVTPHHSAGVEAPVGVGGS